MLARESERERFNDPNRFVPGERDTVGLYAMFVKLVNADAKGRLEPFIGHLKLLSKGEPTSNVKHSSDPESNKLFELYFGLSVSSLASKVEMDNPKKSAGSNPDVIAQIGDKRWGFACKVVHSENPQTHFDRWVDGVDQIERAEVDYGIVVFKLTNIFKHDSVFQSRSDGAAVKYSAFSHPGQADARLNDFVTCFVNDVQESVGKEQLRAIFRSSKCFPMCLAFVQTTAPIMQGSKAVTTCLSCAISIAVTGQRLVCPCSTLEQVGKQLVSQVVSSKVLLPG
ncbi:MAG TPA: hypothetical protein PKA27_08335 [Fimbriimonadaceae bacterium]|nr:hypothetical protein [Fimbriimonadaceae bacterium]